MIKAKIPLNKVNPYFETGPIVSLQLAATGETTINGQVQTQDYSAFYNPIRRWWPKSLFKALTVILFL